MRRPGILQEILNKDYEEESSSPVTPPLQDSHGFLVFVFFFCIVSLQSFPRDVHVDWGHVFSVMTFSFHCLSVLDDLGKL